MQVGDVGGDAGQCMGGTWVVWWNLAALHAGQSVFGLGADRAVLLVQVFLLLGRFVAVGRLRYAMITSGFPR
ncbi:hypothetical protein [Micromonospora matsumotoense]|uniref:hypothetical protein n=1 Tax=Micromonospora matsumotoense TaxID=121616 RepID=UPI00114D0E68|nr:hypothetical protein [Micromonospora matsumotoense]